MSVTSNLITFEPLGFRAPKAESKAFLCDGHIWSTSKANIAQGVWPRSSTIEYFWEALALGLWVECLITPFRI
jgi:hypothetical protein